jgi:hypothetical protein
MENQNEATTKIIKRDQYSRFEKKLLSCGFQPLEFNAETIEHGMGYIKQYLNDPSKKIDDETRLCLGLHYLQFGTQLYLMRRS